MEKYGVCASNYIAAIMQNYVCFFDCIEKENKGCKKYSFRVLTKIFFSILEVFNMRQENLGKD